MEINNITRSSVLTAIQSLIDLDSLSPGRIEFYDNTGILLATAGLAPISMTISSGIGSFINIMPYLRATVIYQGTANRWSLINYNDVVIFTGTCGDQSHLDKDIVFNTITLDWNVNDVVIIGKLSLTIPSGTNDYLA
jgi:hypothetical protein